MESVEVSAKTVDEAIDIALEDLGLKRSQVDIEVLTPGKPGLFGLGGEQARVRVTALVEPIRRPAEDGEEEPIPEELLGERVEIKDLDAEEVQYAHQFLRELLVLMDIIADVSVREPETAADGLGRATAVLDVEGEDLGLLIGRRGSTLSALQYLINVLVTRKLGSRASRRAAHDATAVPGYRPHRPGPHLGKRSRLVAAGRRCLLRLHDGA